MKKIIALALAACAAAQVVAAVPARGAKRAAASSAPAAEPVADERVSIEQFPTIGRLATLAAPNVPGTSNIRGKCAVNQRRWIVLEAKYQTMAKWHDRLTFTWHVLLDSKTATENKNNKDGLPPYSYFTATTTYANIPRGRHAASVCLHPSYYERFGEPAAVGLVITNDKGDILAGDCESQIKGIESHPKAVTEAFWNKSDIMGATVGNTDDPMIERREGLLDRSKTIWALVNPDDYELVIQ